jgi:radical SAM protein with 4Fe4S-binding SPASM domain
VWGYTSGHRSVGCACGTSYFYVSPYGDVMSCDFNHMKFGNVKERPLWRIWDEMSSQEDFLRAKWGGCKIGDSSSLAKETVRG